MKNHLLKYLIALNFLILAMPFFQTCSNDSIISDQIEKNLYNKEMRSSSQITIKDRADAIEKSQQESTSNGYLLFYNAITKFNLTLDGFFDIPFLIVPILNLLLFIFSFTKKQKLIMLLNALQFLGTISGLIILVLISDDILQVKYGMYLLVINSILIFYTSIKIVSIARSQRSPTQAY
jgi:hypothetical protein